MTWVHWRKWKNFSGALIQGKGEFLPREDFRFWERAVWLTSQVESGGHFGTVISYDGTGMTAGITQTIAVYPKELETDDGNVEDDQGPLWDLLQIVKDSNPKTTATLEAALKEKSLVLLDGSLKRLPDLKTADGLYIRNTLSPLNGKVPRTGQNWEIAKQWALLFHEVFSNPDSFEPQVLHAVRHLKVVMNRKNSHCNTASLYRTQQNEIEVTSPLQLAICVFLSYSVNAPTMAYRKMKQAIEIETHLQHELSLDPNRLAKRIIRVFGTSNFGRWNMAVPNGRYQRTRKAAMRLWPQTYFEGPSCTMPTKL